MKSLARSLLIFVPLAWCAAAQSTIEVVVKGVPSDASEVVVVADIVQAPSSEYEDAPAVVAPAANQIPTVAAAPVLAQIPGAGVAPAPAAAPAPEQPRRRRRQVVASPIVRTAVPVNGASSITARVTVAEGENYQVRALALRGSDAAPTMMAGGRVGGLKVSAEQSANTAIALQAPVLTLSSANPAVVAPGARYTLAGTIKDAAQSLGTKSRMRVWISEGAPPQANYTGVQTSTVDVTLKGEEIAFQFDLVAPKQATVLYYQFGELPGDFARTDGTQAPFLVLPDIASGAKPLQLRVEPAKISAVP